MVVETPQAIALALWQLLVDATPVLSGLTRANWRLGVNNIMEGPAVRLSAEEYRRRQKGNGDPLPPPSVPTLPEAKPGDVYYISNGTVDPAGHQYWEYILDGTPSQPRPWFSLALMEVQTVAPAVIRARSFKLMSLVE
jgi:hypothetical protein